MSPLYEAVIDVLHLVTERSSQRRWSTIFVKNSQNSQGNTCAGVSTYQFDSQSIGLPDKPRSHWKCGVRKRRS